MNFPKNHNLNIQAFEKMLEYKRVTNSYKLYWFYALFEKIKNKKIKFKFTDIILKMITKCWYTITEYKLNFGSQDKLGDLVLYIYENYKIDKDVNEKELMSYLFEIYKYDKVVQKQVNDICNYVPYRLISTFYPEITGLKDYKKNGEIETLSQKDNRAIYKIDKKKLIINEPWYKYIYKNQLIIKGWLKYKLIYFLQNRNPNVPAIPFKLEPFRKRNLNKAKKYWKKINKINKLNDLYTGNEINFDKNISIDHFIPWSFVMHNKLWNLIPTYKNVNSSKNDKLPKLDKYLNEFCDIQYQGYKIAVKNNFSNKKIEDYIELTDDIKLKEVISKNKFVNSLKSNIKPLYEIARNQGFLLWNPNKL